MALNFVDRLLTIVVTATLTSAAWVVVGSSYVDKAELGSSAAAPSTAPSATSEAVEELLPAAAPAGDLVIPVAGIAASDVHSTFNDIRDGARKHEALDIMAPAGTPVLAAAAGKVEKLFLSDAGGKTVYVRSPDGRTIYYYAHLRDYAANLKEGEDVAQGARLGTVGATGNADPAAPHLHFAIMATTPEAKWYDEARAIDPYPLLVGRN